MQSASVGAHSKKTASRSEDKVGCTWGTLPAGENGTIREDRDKISLCSRAFQSSSVNFVDLIDIL